MVFTNKTKGNVVYEKNGETYSISAKRFLSKSKIGFSHVESFLGSRSIRIVDKGISNIRFVDCNFNLSKKELRLYIAVESKDTKIQMTNVNFEKVKEIMINTAGHISINNLSGIGHFKIVGDRVNATFLRDLDLEIRANSISISDCIATNDSFLYLNAEKKIVLQNVEVETTYGIDISSPKIEYSGISLTSNAIKVRGFLDTNYMQNDVYTIDDDVLNRLASINKFQSVLKGIRQNINEQIEQKTNEIGEQQQLLVESKIQVLQDEIAYLSSLPEIAKNDAKADLNKKTVSSFVKIKK